MTRFGGLAVFALLFIACGNATSSSAPPTPNLTVSEKDNGRPVSMRVGQVLLVRLTAGDGYGAWSRPTSSNTEVLAWLAVQPASSDRVTSLLLAATFAGSSEIFSGSPHICPGSYVGPPSPGAVSCSDGETQFNFIVDVLAGGQEQFDLMTEWPQTSLSYHLNIGDTLAVDGILVDPGLRTTYVAPDPKVLATVTDPHPTTDGRVIYRGIGPGTTAITYTECPANPEVMRACTGFTVRVTVVARTM